MNNYIVTRDPKIRLVIIGIVLLLIVASFSFLGNKVDNAQEAAQRGDYQAVQEEIEPITKIVNNKENIKDQGLKILFLATAVIPVLLGIGGFVIKNVRTNHRKVFEEFALRHQFTYHKEFGSEPTVTGSNKKGLYHLSIITSEEKKQKTLITLNAEEVIEQFSIHTEDEYLFSGDKDIKRTIERNMKALLEQTKGFWRVRKGEISYEHKNIIRNIEELEQIYIIVQKMRQELSKMQF